MKTINGIIRFTVCLVTLSLTMGCPPLEDDLAEEEALFMPDTEETADDLTLRLTVETEEDQITAIASNAMTVFNDQVWSVGGDRPGARVDQSDIWNSENGVNWVSVASNPFNYREESKLVQYDNKLWLIGGRDLEGDPISEVWSSEDGFIWDLVTSAPAFMATVNHDVVVFDDRMMLIARRIDAPDRVSVWSSINGADWQLEADNAFSGREEFAAVVFNNTLYVLGGFDPTVASLPINNDIWASSNGRDWAQVATSTIFQARYAHTATVYNDKVFVAGGIGRNASTLAIQGNLWYSEDMVNWLEYEPFRSDIGITDHAALVFDEKLWLFFGIEGGEFPDGDESSKIFSIQEE